MFKIKKKKKKNISIKLIKRHNKVRFVSRLVFCINYNFFYKILNKLNFLKRRRKKKILKRLRKYSFFIKIRSLYRINSFYQVYNSNNNNNIIYKNIFLYNKYMYIYQLFVFISLEYYKITDYQIELIRRAARRCFGKKSTIYIYVYAQFKLVKRTNQIRMGGGKGNKLFKVIYPLYPGCIFFGFYGVRFINLKSFYIKIRKKLPFVFKYSCLTRI